MENEHIVKAMSLREETPSNCAQAVLLSYAEELGISKELAANLACNFGGGMKCGGVCGAITGGLMVLGAKGIANPQQINKFRQAIAAKHSGMTDCADLLRASMINGIDRKTHCDGLIRESIEMIDKIADEN